MTEETPPTKVYLSRPRDESLEAFKEWITEFPTRLTGNVEDDESISKDEWAKLWKEFWS